jgi:hypothetical protein
MKRVLLGSAFATLCGWVSGWLCLFTVYFFGNQQYKFAHITAALWDDLGLFLWMGFFVVPTWLIIVAPLYWAMPRRSYFWKWFLCVPFGAFVGVVVLLSPVAYSEIIVYHSTFSDLISTWPLSLPAAVLGGVTGLVGRLTLDYFNPSNS